MQRYIFVLNLIFNVVAPVILHENVNITIVCFFASRTRLEQPSPLHGLIREEGSNLRYHIF